MSLEAKIWKVFLSKSRSTIVLACGGGGERERLGEEVGAYVVGGGGGALLLVPAGVVKGRAAAADGPVLVWHLRGEGGVLKVPVAAGGVSEVPDAAPRPTK